MPEDTQSETVQAESEAVPPAQPEVDAMQRQEDIVQPEAEAMSETVQLEAVGFVQTKRHSKQILEGEAVGTDLHAVVQIRSSCFSLQKLPG